MKLIRRNFTGAFSRKAVRTSLLALLAMSLAYGASEVSNGGAVNPLTCVNSSCNYFTQSGCEKNSDYCQSCNWNCWYCYSTCGMVQ